MNNDISKKIIESINNINNKTFKVMFFVVDTKGAPSGYLTYIYKTAKTLKDLGYNVQMLHTETDFVGVESWLGEEYSLLTHINIDKDKPNVGPSDILFIPEIYSNIMMQTKKMPCKRVAILQNFNYLTQIIPAGSKWEDFGIKDCITTTNKLKKQINNIFPNVNTRIISPCISDVFFDDYKPKKLIFNVVCKEQTDINNIVKPFFWKYPMYKWVAFRELRNLPKEDFSKYLREAAFTIWVDKDSEFGYSALESMKCGSIVIGKIPNNQSDWIFNGDEINNNAVWYFDDDDVHTLIAGAIDSFLNDNINNDIYVNMKNTYEKYSEENFINNVISIYVNDIFENHKKELENTLNIIENKKM